VVYQAIPKYPYRSLALLVIEFNSIYKYTCICLICRAFLFPSDLQIELEYWAETGEFDEDELHEVR
jgi:hypothetical protein